MEASFTNGGDRQSVPSARRGFAAHVGAGSVGQGRAVPALLEHAGRSWTSRFISCRSTSTPRPLLTMMSPILPGGVKPQPPSDLYPIYLVLAGLGVLAFLGVGMVAARKRRHEHGRLWLPEGFKTTETSKKKRREPVGEDSVGLK